jgi:benzaldehyde dehydrogenase (NAD)
MARPGRAGHRGQGRRRGGRVANDTEYGLVAAIQTGSRFGSQSSWDEFTQWQWVTSRPTAPGFPF